MTTEEVNNKFTKIFNNYNKVRELLAEIKEIIKDSNKLASSIPYTALENIDYSIIEVDLPITMPSKIMYGCSKKRKKPTMTKGYKATYNYKCLNQTYEVGQEYKIEGKPQICVKGFHYCNDAMNVLIYYPIKPTFKLLEIQDLNTSESDFQYDYDSLSSKSCSNHIKIIREINDPDELMHLLGKNFTYDQENKILKINWRSGFYFVLFDDHDCVITTINHTNYKTYDDLINLRKQRLNDNEIFLELNKRWANDYLLKDNSICSYPTQ